MPEHGEEEDVVERMLTAVEEVADVLLLIDLLETTLKYMATPLHSAAETAAGDQFQKELEHAGNAMHSMATISLLLRCLIATTDPVRVVSWMQAELVRIKEASGLA